jgi:tetratricopeptide (TPR) repeat protein
MRACRTRLISGGLWLAVLVAPIAAADSDAQIRLRTAIAADDRGNGAAAAALLQALIDAPEFQTLDQPSQHVALQLGAKTALQTGKPDLAQQFAARATAMPQQSIDDWKYRLTASVRLSDARDEALVIATIAREVGHDASVLSDVQVLAAVNDTNRPELEQQRFDMLQALYAVQWRPEDDRRASVVWRELSLMLLARGNVDRAVEVAANISDPYATVAMMADRRYRPLFKSRLVRTDVANMAIDNIARLRLQMQQRPRSLNTALRLGLALLHSGRYQDVLAVTTDVDRRSQATGAPAYDDMDKLSWLVRLQARALARLGRDEEALQQLHRAIGLIDKNDSVNQPINLADALCEFGRPAEALALLPKDALASAYGKMQIQWVRLTAAVELGTAQDVESSLAYMRAHQADSPRTLQLALVRAGALDEAEQILLSRLSDANQRGAALFESQQFAVPPGPALVLQWHRQQSDFLQRAPVRAAISRVGVLERYPWLEDPND